MNKENLLKCLSDGLNHILCLALDDDDQKKIEAAVEMFIFEDASRYSEQELLFNFSTMEKGLNRFLNYMELQKSLTGVTIH